MGVYFDRESRLCYNRFRYHGPQTGIFIGQDPIGLVGGFNPYEFAPNVFGWIDPWGLAKAGISKYTYSKLSRGEWEAFEAALSKGMIARAEGVTGIKQVKGKKCRGQEYEFELKVFGEYGNKRLYGNAEDVDLKPKKGCRKEENKHDGISGFDKQHMR